MRQYSLSLRNPIFSSYFALIMSALVITICLIGCGPSVKFIRTGTAMASKLDDCTIEVFNSKLPEREYDELGILEGEGAYSYTSVEKVLPKLIQEACRAGGDAIIIKTIQKYVYDSDSERIHVTATVIMWQE